MRARTDVLSGLGEAFGDVCTADLGRLAQEVLAPRDDINSSFLDQMLSLATDGCPGFESVDVPTECAREGYLDLPTAQRALRHYLTASFDEALRGGGPGIDADAYDDVVLR